MSQYEPRYIIEHNGERMSLARFAKLVGTSNQAVYRRWHKGERDPKKLAMPPDARRARRGNL